MIRRLGYLTGAIALGTTGLVFTENTPAPLLSLYKIANTAIAGIKMARIYKDHSQQNTISHKQLSQSQKKQQLQKQISNKHFKASRHLRDALAKNGGIYIKLGQLIATLDVVVPDQYRQVLGTLTRSCQKRSFKSIKQTFQEDYQGIKIQQIFKQFQQQPISSASIAQVHRAVLKNGQQVAVKIQHRQLAEGVNSDLAIMKNFVKIAKLLFKDDFKYGWLVQEFEKNLKKQLNFKNQAKNGQRTADFLKRRGFNNIAVPKILLPATNRVLVMQFIHGLHVDQLTKMKALGIKASSIGKNFAKANIQMIHRQGFVHADPHSGNLMVRKNKKNQDQLVILDHGLYQELTQQMRKDYNKLWLGIVLKDQKMFTQAASKLGTKKGRLLCSMLTSKGDEQLLSGGKQRFKLDPKDRPKIQQRAAAMHNDIINVLNQLKRQILLMMKVNQFARTIQNQLGGRQMGVYQDIAKQCVNNLQFGFFKRWWLYLKIYWVNR